MTIFSKNKNQTAPVPESCARCGAQGDTVHLHFIVAPDDATQSTTPKPVWLCAACKAEAHRDAPGN